MSFVAQKSPGVVALSSKERPIQLKYTVDKGQDLASNLRAMGFPLKLARPLAALTDASPNEVVLAEAMRVLGDEEDPVALLHANRGRIKSWWSGLRECVMRYYDVWEVYPKDRAHVVTDCEARFCTRDNKQFKFRFKFDVASKVERGLLLLGYPPSETSSMASVAGVLDEMVLGLMLVHGCKGSGVVDFDEANVMPFLEANRTHLWGWWLALQECVTGYYKEEATEKLGEAVGAG